MASTYTPIATTTLGSAVASYTFSSIPSTYTDLVAVYSGSMVTSDYLLVRVGNGSIDTGTNYSSTRMVGNGSTAISGRDTNATFFAAPDPLTTGQNNVTVHFQNYSNTSVNKTVLMRANVPATSTSAVVGLWRNTAAINTISFVANGGTNIAAGSTFTLYGIQAA